MTGSAVAPGVAAQLPTSLPFRLVLPRGWQLTGVEVGGAEPGTDYWNVVLHLTSGEREVRIHVFTGEGEPMQSPTTVTLGGRTWLLGAPAASGDAGALDQRASTAVGTYTAWVDAADDADVRILATGFAFVPHPEDVTSWTARAGVFSGG